MPFKYVNDPEISLRDEQIELFKVFQIDSLIKCSNIYVDNYKDCPEIYNNYLAIIIPLIINYDKTDKHNDIKNMFVKMFTALPLNAIKQIIDNYNNLYVDKTIIKAIFDNPDNLVLEYVLKNKKLDYLTNVQMLAYFSLVPDKMHEFYDILFTKHCGKYLFRGTVTQGEHYENKKYYDEMFKANGNFIEKYSSILNSIGIKVFYSIPREPSFCFNYRSICLVKDNYGFDNYLDYSCKESSITQSAMDNFKNMTCPQKLTECIKQYISNYYDAPSVYYNYIVAAYYYLMEFQFKKIYPDIAIRNRDSYIGSALQPFNDITTRIIKTLTPDIVSYCININNIYSAYINFDVVAFIKNKDTLRYVLSKHNIKYDDHIRFLSDVITKNKWPGKQVKLISKVYGTILDINSNQACIATYYVNCCSNPTQSEINFLNNIGYTIKHISLGEQGKKAIIISKSGTMCVVTKNSSEHIVTCDLNKKLEKYYSNPEKFSVTFLTKENQYVIKENVKEDKVTSWIPLVSYISVVTVSKLYKTIKIIS